MIGLLGTAYVLLLFGFVFRKDNQKMEQIH